MPVSNGRLHECSRQRHTILGGKFTRNGHFHFAVKPAVCPLVSIRCFPKFLRAFLRPRRHVSMLDIHEIIPVRACMCSGGAIKIGGM